MTTAPRKTRGKASDAPQWVQSMRADLKLIGQGWTVRSVRDRMFLTVHHEGGERSNLQTRIEWIPNNKLELLNTCQELKRLMTPDAGRPAMGMKQAYELLTNASELETTHKDPRGEWAGKGFNWQVAIERFETHKVKSNQVTERTWHRNWRNPMEHALAALSTQPRPTTSSALFDRLLSDCKLEPGSQGRRRRMLCTASLLTFAVDRLGADRDRWTPPQDLSDYIGLKAKGQQLTTYMSDAQIVLLLASIPDPQWRDAIAMVACFGLRPVELHTVSANGDMLHVDWKKRTARLREGTKPRDVYGLDPIGLPGESERLLAKLAAEGLEMLPKACRHVRCGERLENYLQRRSRWQELVAEIARQPTLGRTGNKLVPYSMRHAYAERARQIGVPTNLAALWMGHSEQTHNKNYSGTTEQGQENAKALVAAAQARLQPKAG